MFFHRITIEDLVDVALTQRRARRIIDEWPIEIADIKKVIIQHFRVMGINTVDSLKIGKLLQENVIFVLRNSQEIHKMINEAKLAQEKSRKRNLAD